MKFSKRIITTLLAVLMLLGAFSGLSINVLAASAKDEELTQEEIIKRTYLGQSYSTPQEKLDTMTLMLERDGYELYVDPVSGEVATLEVASGNIAFSNPYDVAGSEMDIVNGTKKNGSASTQTQILSQLIVQYIDNGTTKYLYSFAEAAMREQITVINIKNGVRIEYTVGREESRKLVPRLISEKNFDELIRQPLETAVENGELSQFMADKVLKGFYVLKGLEFEKTQRGKDNLLATYPICAKMNVYEFATDASAVEVNTVESIIKAYCEDYTFEQMDADHDETGYEATDEKYPVFKMALEYSLGADGSLSVRMPCNGLRYDMASYTLESISILPYFGAGNSKNPGYNFYPDGSGSLFDFEQLNTKSTTTIRGKVYGSDYAYHTLTGTYQKAIRYPVYGTVATETIYSFTCTDANGMTHPMEISNTVMDLEEIKAWLEWEGGTSKDFGTTVEKSKMTLASEITEKTYKRGYVAVIESGESLAEIATYHAGSLSPYNTMINYFNPKPKDSYDISDAISVVSNNSMWTVVSDRKYTGNIQIRYQLLSDTAIGEETRKTNQDYKYYEASWLGMAEAYRDYLIGNGTLTKLTAEETQAGIPLYIESFGALETQKVIATIPMNVMTPLTTFDDLMSMYDELSGKGIKNINFKMTGYANGGMYYTVPSSLKWEKVVGGKDGMLALVEKAKEINSGDSGAHLGLFPDFDFAYIQVNKLFDSTNLQKDAVKTIDNRYTSYRQYSATWQTYVSFYQLAVSPARYSKFYNKLLENYKEYGLNSMSVGSLGTALNSDFDEDDPYNREDNKTYTIQAFSDLKDAGYSLMTDGGNAYTWGYVDHIINVDLDSSRYVKSSASVPFIGAVLHGYVEFAGTPFNEEGDTDYAILRAIENGAGLYFILSYQNTNELKENRYLSQYYSVRYDIWRDDVVAYYTQLNDLLKDVQTKVIIDHRFLEGERVLDKDELLLEIEQSLQNAIDEELKKQESIENAQVVAVGDAWNNALNAKRDVLDLIKAMEKKNADILSTYDRVAYMASKEGMANPFNSALGAIQKIVNPEEEDDVDLSGTDMTEHKEYALEVMQAHINAIKNTAADVYEKYAEQQKLLKDVYAVIEEAKASIEIIRNSDLSAEVKANLISYMEQCVVDAEACVVDAENLVDVRLDLITNDAEGLSPVMKAALVCSDSITQLDTKYALWVDIAVYVKESYSGAVFFTAQDILDSIVIDEGEDDEDSDEEVDVYDKYHVDNNKIVVVTYGDRDEKTGVKTAYKTFILNYNTFAVVVEYENVKYTIPSGGYVVLYN